MLNNKLKSFIEKIPKAELHVHIEGTLEPELLFKLADRNKVRIKHKSIDELKQAYKFQDLQSFLDIYYEGASVLLTEQDFYDLTWTYLEKRSEQNIIHAEIFFDPQTHTERGVKFEVMMEGITEALKDGQKKLNLSSDLIMCFLRHLSEGSALATLEQSLPFKDKIIGVGLSSSELGHPPTKFLNTFEKAISQGYLPVAHAGEEGPPEYIWEAINHLKVLRIDHGVRCIEDNALIKEIIDRRLPLTVCPLSNVELKVFKSLKEHNLKKLLDAEVLVTINSDDPSYFGGYVNENYLEAAKALSLTEKDIYAFAKNSFEASFLNKAEKNKMISLVDKFTQTIT